MLDKFKISTAKRNLKKALKQAKQHEGKVCNIRDAQSVGVIALVEDKADYFFVRKYILSLKEDFGVKDVFALVYFPEKEIPDFLAPRVDFDFFSKGDLNWSLKPSNPTINNFIAKPQDILVDLTNKEVIPLRYILLDSNANFKVGVYKKENEDFYDLMIDNKGKNREDFVKNINHYLSMLNAK